METDHQLTVRRPCADGRGLCAILCSVPGEAKCVEICVVHHEPQANRAAA